jgi:hypothetical protein
MLVARQRRSSQHRDGSGHEPHRSLASQRKKRGAAPPLPAQRPDGGERTDFRDLSPAARERYLERWTTAQRRFVDQPAVPVGEADRLVNEVMHDSGYLGEEHFGQPAADRPVDRPALVKPYRAAHAIALRARRSLASPEGAMMHFRSLFHELLAPEGRSSLDDGQRSDARHTWRRTMMERGDQSRSAMGVGSPRASQPAGGSDSWAEIRQGDVFPAGTPVAPIVVADPLQRSSSDIGQPRERGGDRRTERPTAWAVAAEARLATDAGDGPAPPLPADSRTDFQRRWEKIQRQFVGEAARSARGLSGSRIPIDTVGAQERWLVPRTAQATCYQLRLTELTGMPS